MNAIDTNIFAYTFDPADPGKQDCARRLVRDLVSKSDETVLLWQVAAAFLAVLRKAERQGRLTSAEVRARFQEVLQLFSLKIPTVQILERSFLLHERFSLSHWDSLLIGACKEAGVTCLYSEDMQHGADYDGVKIVNPFA
jgi:predicted nucleic acid-binding protein